MRLRGATEPIIEIKSKDLRRTLEDELEGLSLSSGDLVSMKFRFTIEVDDKVEKVIRDHFGNPLCGHRSRFIGSTG